MAAKEEEFIEVKKVKGKGIKKRHVADGNDSERILEDPAYVTKRIKEFQAQLVESKILEPFIKQFPCDGPSLVGYGIGSFASSHVAKYHMAAMLVLKDRVPAAQRCGTSNCFIYDPIFSEWERQFVEQCGFFVIQENEEGRRKVHSNRFDKSSTVFFMPHCGKALYNNLLFANWTPDDLWCCVIIGNDLRDLADSLVTPDQQTEYSYIHRAVNAGGNFTRIDVPKSSEIPREVFHGMSMHQWAPLYLPLEDDHEFWDSQKLPTYREDVEIIRNMDPEKRSWVFQY